MSGLLHSYTFTNPLKVSDSIQGDSFEGKIQGGVSLSQGKAFFNNQGTHTNKTFISLPSNPISQFKVITIELWADLASISHNSSSSRSLFYFGQPSQLSIRCSHNQSSGTISCFGCSNSNSCTSMSSLTSYNSGPVHLVAVFNSITGAMSLYINSISQSTASLPPQFSSLPKGDAPDFLFLIGSSVVKNEESFQGSLDEFRIWAGVVTSSSVTSHYQNGPTSDFTSYNSDLCEFIFSLFSFLFFLLFFLISSHPLVRSFETQILIHQRCF